MVSDCGAIGDIYLNHKTSPTPQEGVARAGLLKEADVDRALRRLLYARFKLGLFDPPVPIGVVTGRIQVR